MPDLPRNLYLGAEDWVAQQPSITERDLALVRNQRHTLIGHVTHKAERFIVSIKSLRDFDGTGNAGDALGHIEALRDDLGKLATNLINDVEDAEVRYEKAHRSFLAESAQSAPDKVVTDVRVVQGPVLHMDASKVSPADVAAVSKTIREMHLRNLR